MIDNNGLYNNFWILHGTVVVLYMHMFYWLSNYLWLAKMIFSFFGFFKKRANKIYFFGAEESFVSVGFNGTLFLMPSCKLAGTAFFSGWDIAGGGDGEVFGS